MSDDFIAWLRPITGVGCNLNSSRYAVASELSRLRAEVERLTAALSDERAHADALADTLYSMDGLQKIDCEMRDSAVQQHRARRQG